MSIHAFRLLFLAAVLMLRLISCLHQLFTVFGMPAYIHSDRSELGLRVT